MTTTCVERLAGEEGFFFFSSFFFVFFRVARATECVGLFLFLFQMPFLQTLAANLFIYFNFQSGVCLAYSSTLQSVDCEAVLVECRIRAQSEPLP